MPDGNDYISKTYQALKDNLQGFNKSEQEYRNMITTDSNYRNRVYTALKDNVQGFNRTQDDFYTQLNVKQPVEKQRVQAPGGDPVVQQRVNEVTRYLQDKLFQKQDNLTTPQPLKIYAAATASNEKKVNDKIIIENFKTPKPKKNRPAVFTGPDDTQRILAIKYGNEWKQKATPQELKMVGQEREEFYREYEKTGAPVLNAQDFKQKEIEQNIIKASNEFYNTPTGQVFYNIIRPLGYASGKAIANIGAGLIRYGGRISGATFAGGILGVENHLTEDWADGWSDHFDPDKRWAGTFGDKKLSPTKLQGGLFNDGKINLAQLLPSTVETIGTMSFLMAGPASTPALIGKSFLLIEQDYRNEGKKAGLTGAALDNFAFVSAFSNSLLEAVSPNTLITGKFRSGLAKEYTQAITNGFTNKVALKLAGEKLVNEIGRENLQEGLQLAGDKIVRLITDKTLDQPVFNDDLSLNGMKDELLETFVLTSIPTFSLSVKGTIRSAKPSNLEKSTWYNVSQNEQGYKDIINKQILSGGLTPEQGANASEFFTKYRIAVDQAKEFGFSPSQQTEAAWEIYRGNDINETVAKFQGNPVLKATIAPQIKKEQDEVVNNIKRVGLGVPEIGAEINGGELANIIGNIGDKGGAGESLQKIVEDNVYRVEEIDLKELYEKKQSFRDLVETYDKKEDEQGLLVPAIIGLDGKIIDGRSRLAQQYINGQKTAQVFKQLKTEADIGSGVGGDVEFTAYRFGGEGEDGVTFSSKNKDYSEQYAIVKGGKTEDVKEVTVTAKNPITIDLSTKEFSSPSAEQKYIAEAKKNGNDLVIFRDKENGDEFYAKIDQSLPTPAAEAITPQNKEVELPEVKKVKSFKTDEGTFDVYDIEKDVMGRGDMFTVLKDKDGWIIRNAFVPDNLQKKGIGTEFYKKMNEESIKATGKPLRSTQPRTLLTGEVVHELTPKAIKLWDSLVKSGVAEKLGEKDYAFKPLPTQIKTPDKEQPYKGRKSNVVYIEGKRVVKYKNGKLIDTNTPRGKNALKQHEDNYIYTFREKANTKAMSENIAPEDRGRWIVENSSNPAEIADVFLSEPKQTRFRDKKEELIAEYGIGKFYDKDFAGYDDANNITDGMARNYFVGKSNRRRESIDGYAKELSDHYGIEFDPSDITDFIKRFPNREFVAEDRSQTAIIAQERFETLTGIPLTDRVAKIAAAQLLSKEQLAAAEQQVNSELESGTWNIPEEVQMAWLEEEAQFEINEETNDNIDNLITDYEKESATNEGADREQPQNEEGTKQSSGEKAGSGTGTAAQKNGSGESVAELERQRDEEISKAIKPVLKLNFVGATELVNSKDPIGNKEKHNELKNRYKDLLKLIECL